MIFFNKPTPQQTWSKYQKDIAMSFEESFIDGYNFEAFLYKECQNKIAEIQYNIPKHLLDYVAFDLMAADFYDQHRSLLVWKDQQLFRTLKYNTSYDNFLKGS